jgi:hypothetical protein
MGWFACPKCGAWRKIGSVVGPEDELVAGCVSCGDESYWITVEGDHVPEAEL